MVAPYQQPQSTPWQMQPYQYQQPQQPMWQQPQYLASPWQQAQMQAGQPQQPAWQAAPAPQWAIGSTAQAQQQAYTPQATPAWAEGERARLGTGQPWQPSLLTEGDPSAEAERAKAAAQADAATRAREDDAAAKAAQGGGGQQTAQGFRVNTANGYGNPRGYYYNGHAVEGDQGQWILLPVDYNEAQDTRRWEYGGKMEESTMRRAVRYAYDDVRDGRSNNFDEALKARLTQFYNEAGGQGVGYTLAGLSTTQPSTQPGTQPGTDPGTTTPGASQPGTTQPGSGATLRNFGQFQTDDLATALQAAANSPDRAAQLLRLARGQTGRPLGRLGDFRDSLYGRALQTALGLGGVEGFGNIEQLANDFLGNAVQGNNLIGYGGDIGRRVAGLDFAGMDSATMEQMLRAGLAMQGIGMGALGGSVQQGRLDDILWQDWARNLADSSNDQRNFADLLQGSPFLRAMQAYGR